MISEFQWSKWRRAGAVKPRYAIGSAYVFATVMDDNTLRSVDAYSSAVVTICPDNTTMVLLYETHGRNYHAASRKAREIAPSWVYPWLAQGKLWHDWRWNNRGKLDAPEYVQKLARVKREEINKWLAGQS